MQFIAVSLVALVGSAAAFAPVSQSSRSTTSLNAFTVSLFVFVQYPTSIRFSHPDLDATSALTHVVSLVHIFFLSCDSTMLLRLL
jgi:hypothetical protein